jgi:PAS domain S-box-containing protein
MADKTVNKFNWKRIRDILGSRRRQARVELVGAFLLPLAFYILATVLSYERTLKIDQSSVALLVMVICLFWFIYRRNSDLQSEIVLRQTAEKNFFESEERYRALFERSLECVYVHDFEGNFIDVNDVALNLTGYSAEDIRTLNFIDLLPREQVPVAVKSFEEIITRGYQENINEFKVKRKDGTYVYLETQASLILKSGRPYAILGIGRDITMRKQMEVRIRGYSAELEERFAELQVAYKKLQELDKMKDSLLSTVSHELRTPLTSIKSFTEILLTYENDEETEREFLTTINEQCDRLTRLISDFLDLAKIESGRIQWETVEVAMADIVKTAVSTSQALFTTAGLQVSVDVESDLPIVWGDRDRVLQIVMNLLDNAIKFTPDGGYIRVTAERVDGNDISEMIKVSVIDSGMGIDPRAQESIFEKFAQVGDTLRNKPSGTGLGLPICKRIVEHYNGRMWVESELGKGSAFIFTLPAGVKAANDEPVAEDAQVEIRDSSPVN